MVSMIFKFYAIIFSAVYRWDPRMYELFVAPNPYEETHRRHKSYENVSTSVKNRNTLLFSASTP